ncbi:Ypd1p [Sugiyamaella lignohabitans]|uniref:Ypd1p n=1 Tax=Sugiyamaella lignohabitans TaxID=796027 RepID=A0A167CZC7_9ASCO|nr:Ypd1p [Sugiyamaella lignohabitans]ANB12289.1 Ypd1p [Sugiyamaella lignohabitans]
MSEDTTHASIATEPHSTAAGSTHSTHSSQSLANEPTTFGSSSDAGGGLDSGAGSSAAAAAAAETEGLTAEEAEEQAELAAIAAGSSHTDIIDWTTFGQILEMDEDEEDRDFSKGIVINFFEQAQVTFEQMETALKEGNLSDLSALGHFLKGSSAALGLTKVKNSCEKIQHFGAGKDETGSTEVNDEALCLERIRTTLAVVREEYEESEKYLRKFFDGAM